MFHQRKPCLYMSRPVESVAFSGPPSVMTYGSAKNWKYPIGVSTPRRETWARAAAAVICRNSCHRPGAVQAGGLVERLRDACEPGDEEDHRVAEVLPDARRMIAGIAHLRVAEPVDRRNPEQLETAVQAAEAGVVEVPEHDRHRDERRDVGAKKTSGRALPARELGVRRSAAAERHAERQRAADEHEVETCCASRSRRADRRRAARSSEPDHADVAGCRRARRCRSR
jgi:hypothetical protein